MKFKTGNITMEDWRGT